MSLDDAILKERCRRDAHFFIFGGDGFDGLVTKDEHRPFDPVRRFPDELYLRALLDDYLVSGKILQPESAKYSLAAGTPISFLQHIRGRGIYFVEKSRHVMATWLSCAYLLWRARAFPYQLIIAQSKREEDIAKFVYEKEPHQARISFLEWSLPENLRIAKFPSCAHYNRINFPNGSQIWGIPQGGSIIRSHNPSVVFSDEAAFQPEFGDAFTSTLPCITGGGQLIVVSSAEVSTFQQLCESDA